MRIAFGCALVSVSMIGIGCAGTVRVTPLSPMPASQVAPAQMSVSLYIDREIQALRSRATTPSGDIGLGDITVEFDLGSALAETIRNSARQTFTNVKEVAAPKCTQESAVLFAASLPTPPYIQIHWRGQTPRVGGGTIAEFSVRIAPQSCSGKTSLQSAVARGAGRSENMQAAANWPSEDDFQPGIDLALRDLQANISALFADMAKSQAAP